MTSKWSQSRLLLLVSPLFLYSTCVVFIIIIIIITITIIILWTYRYNIKPPIRMKYPTVTSHAITSRNGSGISAIMQIVLKRTKNSCHIHAARFSECVHCKCSFLQNVCIISGLFHSHSFSSLSYDRSKASSKASSPHSAIQSFLFQMRVSSPFLKVIQ